MKRRYPTGSENEEELQDNGKCETETVNQLFDVPRELLHYSNYVYLFHLYGFEGPNFLYWIE